MPHVFISYVRQNAAAVDRLASALRDAGVNVWLDREKIGPGERWRDSIRSAIQRGAFFIACFSSEYAVRDRSFMNEELTIAIEELRLRPTHRTWFIPVKLSDVPIPEREIGGGQTLADLQWADLASNWDAGIRNLLSVVRRAAVDTAIAAFLEDMHGQPLHLVGIMRRGVQLARHPTPPPKRSEVRINSAYRVDVTCVEPIRAKEDPFRPHPGALLAQRLDAYGFDVCLGHWDSSRLFAKLPPEQVHTLYVIHRNNIKLARRLFEIARNLAFAPRMLIMNTKSVVRASERLAERDILEYCDALCAIRAAA